MAENADSFGTSLLKKYDKEFDQLLSKYTNAYGFENGSNIKEQKGSITVKEVESVTKEIEVQSANLEILEYSAAKLVSEMIAALSKSYDTTFLKDYLHVLQTQSLDAIKHVTYKIMVTVEMSLRESILSQEPVDDNQAVLGAFLIAALLWNSPVVPQARHSLLQLLTLTTEKERIELVQACLRFATPSVMVSLSDMVRMPWYSHGISLSDLFLRGALHALHPTGPMPEWELGFPSVAEVRELIVAVKDDAALFAFLGRVLARIPQNLHFDILQLLESVQPVQQPKNISISSNSSKVDLCKLRILYGENEKVRAATKRE